MKRFLLPALLTASLMSCGPAYAKFGGARAVVVRPAVSAPRPAAPVVPKPVASKPAPSTPSAPADASPSMFSWLPAFLVGTAVSSGGDSDKDKEKKK